MFTPGPSLAETHRLGKMFQLVEEIEAWMLALPDSIFDPACGRLSLDYVLHHAPMTDGQRSQLVVADISNLIEHHGLQTRLYCEAHEVGIRSQMEQIRIVLEDMVGSELALRDDVSLLDLADQPLVARQLRGISDARERLATVANAARNSSKIAVEGARVVKVTPDRIESLDQAQGSAWDQQWFSGLLDDEDANASAETGVEAEGIGTPSDQSPQHHYDPAWEQIYYHAPTVLQVPMVCTPWGLTPMMLCVSDTSETPNTDHLESPCRQDPEDLDEKYWWQRRRTMAAQLAKFLKHAGEDGEVSLDDVLQQHPRLWYKCHSASELAKNLASIGELTPIVVDLLRCTVRLRTEDEALVAACEALMAELEDQRSWKSSSTLSLTDALMSPQVQLHLPRYASKDPIEGAGILRAALENAELLTVGTSDTISWRSHADMLLQPVEEVLASTGKEARIMQKEGEVPLLVLAEEPTIRRLLNRACLKSSKDSLDALRDALLESETLELDTPRMSCRARGDGRQMEVADDQEIQQKRQWRRFGKFPSQKDAIELRKLLKYYFEPFNLQHNRVLMSLVQAQSGSKGVLKHQTRLWFSIEEICYMPRIQKRFAAYDRSRHSDLLAAALQTDEELPVRLPSHGYRREWKSCGSWTKTELWLQLSYMPAFRLFQTTEECEEVRSMLKPEINVGMDNIEALPPHVFLVMSYSLSSDISCRLSPKVQEAEEAIAKGELDPNVVYWETRMQRIKRQLLWHPADVICVQGIQSIGYSDRCSETHGEWFSSDQEPVMNHLVHLYRELAMKNYGVAFSPAMRLPGSSTVCLGNAVFWKRSRWQLKNFWTVPNCAVCIELASRVHCSDLVICCSKSPGVYAIEWGEQLEKEVILHELAPLQSQLLEKAASQDARPVWCGDFGLSAKDVLEGLSEANAAISPSGFKASEAGRNIWQSACFQLLGRHPGTSASRFAEGASSDLIMHDGSLRPLAVLTGLPRSCEGQLKCVKLLGSGYPSDHLLQVAVFAELPSQKTEDENRDKEDSRCFEEADPCQSQDHDKSQCDAVDSTGTTGTTATLAGATGSTGSTGSAPHQEPRNQGVDQSRVWRKARVGRKQWRSFHPDRH
ncbi:PPP2R4 [Symbiodinium necroappetens]|uniref:PPP2R4 protein n=1 Tax=Symbiodinium necroappetens TaxID=1628268 RepID=A0A812TQZ0_9DINO|nr:PPP2R4 [Symbiodinium necroappetens]